MKAELPVNDEYVDARLSACYESALSVGLPQFLKPELASTSFNSAPYVVSIQQLRRDFGFNTERRRLLVAMQKGISLLVNNGFGVPFVLIGGSFTQRDRQFPEDLDAIFLYSVLHRSAGNVGRLPEFRRSLLSERVDARMLPIDGNQLVLLKAFGYFCLLFSKNQRGSSEASRSPLILNVRGAGTPSKS